MTFKGHFRSVAKAELRIWCGTWILNLESYLLITYFCPRFPLTRYELITVVSFKNCASKNAMCQKLVCSNNYSPVCGNDAITYTNHCHLQMATCTAGIQLAHIGECVKGLIFWESLKNLKNPPHLSFSPHFGNLVFGCLWRQSYQNIT